LAAALGRPLLVVGEKSFSATTTASTTDYYPVATAWGLTIKIKKNDSIVRKTSFGQFNFELPDRRNA
jgi:hypothetical protein